MVKKFLAEQLLQEVSIKKQQHPFKAILMTGPAGAGKSFTSKNLLGIPAEVRRFTLNADEIIEDMFPRFGLPLKFIQSDKDPIGKAQAQARGIAQIATKSKAFGYINRAKPLYIDTTGEDPEGMSGVLDSLVELGYDVGIIKVFVPKETSIARDYARKRTVGEEVTDKIWTEYYKNVILGRGYDKHAKGKPNITVLNPEPFYNVYNLSNKDVFDGEGNLIAKARSRVEDVKGDVPVSVEDMDKVIADLRQKVQSFLTPKDVPNPVGKALYDGMVSLLNLTGGILGNDLTDFYKVWLEEDEKLLKNPEILKALETIEKITGEPDNLYANFMALRAKVIKGARGKEHDQTAPTMSKVVSQAIRSGADLPLPRSKEEMDEVVKRVVERLKKSKTRSL